MLKQLGLALTTVTLLFVSACGSNSEVEEQKQTEVITELPERKEPLEPEQRPLEKEQKQEPTYSNLEDFIAENYRYVETINSSVNSGDRSIIYRAEAKSIEEVSNEIQERFSPREVSGIQDEKQVLIYDYPRYFVVLTTDNENPSDTLVELAEHEFVRDNFSPDFFDGLFVLWVLDEVLDVDDWGKKQRSRCYGNCYRGYSTIGKSYKGPKTQPNFRGYSSSVRGGGPSSGK